MWMGPEACVKHEQHPFAPGDTEKLELLWNFFDNLCARKEGCHGSWNAVRMTLKFMKQEKGESVDIFYRQIRDVLYQCEYDPVMQKVLETETLKHGLMNSKIIESTLYPKMQMPTVFSTLPEARKKLRRIYAKWKKSEGTTTWEKLKVQRSSDKRRSPSAKSPRLPVMDVPRANTTAKTPDANIVPDSARPMGKNATNAKGKATLLSSAVAREVLVLTAREILILTGNINKKQNPEEVSRSNCRLRI